MNFSKQIAKHLKDVYFGGNWTVANFKTVLEDVTWEESTQKVTDLNTIATLVFHTNYFVVAVIPVLSGGLLNAKDEFSFNHPPINNDEDWQKLLAKSFNDAETLVSLIEKLSDDKLLEIFADEKYGIYYRNLHGIIEHCHYHLGQIAVINKIIRTR